MKTFPRQPPGRLKTRQRPGMFRGAASGTGTAGATGRLGAVLLVVLVCIVIASLVFMSLVLQTVAERQRGRTEAWQAQAAWLVESGLERAAARLAHDPDYQGETWRLPADALGAPDAAVVQIEVQRVPEQPERRLVGVRADYPDHPQQRARQSKQVVIELGPTS